MSAVSRSAKWSAFPGLGRTHLRTTGDRRSLGSRGDREDPAVWQLALAGCGCLDARDQTRLECES